MKEISLHNVSKQCCPVEALHEFDLSVAALRFDVPVDQAGCNSSILHWMAYGFKSTQGAMEIGDQRASGIFSAESEFAMVFQSRAHDPNLTVARDMMSSLDIRGGKIERFRRNAAKMLRLKPHPVRMAATLQEDTSSGKSWGEPTSGFREHSRLFAQARGTTLRRGQAVVIGGRSDIAGTRDLAGVIPTAAVFSVKTKLTTTTS